MPAPFDSFRTTRWVRTVNLVLQAVLILTLVVGLNYLARNHPVRVDLTKQRRFSLSAETLSYIQNLHQPVRIVVTQSPDDPKSSELRGLLQEYRIATEANPDGRIEVRYMDVYQDRREAEDLGIAQAGVIVLLSGDRRHVVPIDSLYKTRQVPDPNTNVPGAVVRERTHFQGEQELTAKLLDISNPERKKIYFLTGHGELNPTNTDALLGLSETRTQLRMRNFEVETLDLAARGKIPEDASLLIVTRPNSRFSQAEQEMLRNYLGPRAGRLLLFLDPGAAVDEFGLNELLLDDWGIIVDDDLIFDPAPGNMTEDQDLLIYGFSDTHPVTKSFHTHGGAPLRLGAARSVRPAPGGSLASGISTVTLAATSATAWGERSYRLGRFEFTPGVDIRPIPGMEPKNALGIVVAAERVAARAGLAFSVRGGRIVVFGTGDMISNKRIADAGNQNIFLNAVNWMADRDTQLSIPARPIDRFQLSISAGDLAKLRYGLLFGVPGIAAFLGLIVYWTRRH